MHYGKRVNKVVAAFFWILFVSAAWAQAQTLGSTNKKALDLFSEGRQLADQDKLEEALDRFSRAVAEDPGFIQAHLRLMDVYRSLKRFDEMLKLYREKSEKNPESALNHFLYGRALEDMNEKRSQFQKALQADPKYFWAQLGIGGSYLLEGRLDEAIIALNKALEIEPENVEGLNLLGKVYLDKGMPLQACQNFEKAISADSLEVKPYLSLGQALCQLKKYREAEQAFRRAAELAPQDPSPYYFIGVIKELEDNPEGAISAYERFLEIAPDHGYAGLVKNNIERLKKGKSNK